MKNLKTFGKALYELRISKDISLEKISEINELDFINGLNYEDTWFATAQ